MQRRELTNVFCEETHANKGSVPLKGHVAMPREIITLQVGQCGNQSTRRLPPPPFTMRVFRRPALPTRARAGGAAVHRVAPLARRVDAGPRWLLCCHLHAVEMIDRPRKGQGVLWGAWRGRRAPVGFKSTCPAKPRVYSYPRSRCLPFCLVFTIFRHCLADGSMTVGAPMRLLLHARGCHGGGVCEPVCACAYE